MARLTVEDCLEHVDNRYDLVLLATKRARQIHLGAKPLVPENSDKPTVIALREIAENLVRQDNIDETVRNEFNEFNEDFNDSGAFDIPATK